MAKSRSDSITTQFNNSPQAESRTALRQESPLRFAKVANLFLSLPLASLHATPRIPLAVAFLERCRAAYAKIQAEITPVFSTEFLRARLLEQTCEKKNSLPQFAFNFTAFVNELTVAQFFIYFSFSSRTFLCSHRKRFVRGIS